MVNYGMTIFVPGSIEGVRPQVQEALKEQGFGVLTEIDVQKTMKEKIGADMEPYLILGACNPRLAHQALSADRATGLLLPCNVVLRQEGAQVEVSILDPEAMFSLADMSDQTDLAALPQEAKTRLQNALARLEKQFAGS